MKKKLVLTMALALTLSLAACGKGGNAGADEKSEGVMTYAEYMDAALDSEVVIETYVQAKQSWWEDKATLYTQDQDGAYFIYNAVCSETDYAKLTPGTKIKVTGYKTEWAGEVEVAEGATIEIEDGSLYCLRHGCNRSAWQGRRTDQASEPVCVLQRHDRRDL